MRKKLKKAFILIFCLIIFSFSVFAAVTDGNRQEIVAVDSPIYGAMKNLYISTGLALPSTTGPWSMAEMDMMLERINPEQLSESEMTIYEYLLSEIRHTPRFEPEKANGVFGFTISADVAAEMYTRSNPEAFSSPDDYGFAKHMGDYNVPTPLLDIPLETWFGDNIYGFSSFQFGLNRTLIKSDAQKSAHVLTNILMVPPVVLNDLNLNFPYRAFGSIGGGGGTSLLVVIG